VEITMAMNADTRAAAVGALVDQFLDEKHKLRQDVDRSDIAKAIADLAPMGRTARWANTLEQWQGMVADYANPMDWALLQGQVFALHAA
jgi:hypothetical protein